MKKIITLLVILCLVTPVSAATTAEDSLKEGFRVFNTRKYAEARPHFLKAASSAKEEGNNSLLTEALAMVARTYSITKDLGEAEKWLKKTKNVAQKREIKGWSRYLLEKGRLEREQGKTETATKTFKTAYSFCSKNKEHKLAVDAAHMVGLTGTAEEKNQWNLKAIKEAEAGNMTGWLAVAWNNLGAGYEDCKEHEKALDAYQKARNYHWQVGREVNKLAADWAVGHTYRLLGKYEIACTWLRPCLAWSERLKNREWIGFCSMDLGFAQAGLGKDQVALLLLQRGERSLRAVGILNWGDWGKKTYKTLTDEIHRVELRLNNKTGK